MESKVFYNEIDPFAAAWLRELIKEGHIAAGVVDQRSIEDIKPNELKQYTQCHFFAGIGVWSYALRKAGWLDDRPVWTGSCPCQPFSKTGKRKGVADERHLWPAWFHLIQQCRPFTIFGEQVDEVVRGDWLSTVSNDLEGIGYPIGNIIFPACSVGAPHKRQRLYFAAHRMAFTKSNRRTRPIQSSKREEVSKPLVTGMWSKCEWIPCIDRKLRPIEPGFTPLVDGATNRVGRLRGYGNAIVAPQATVFIKAFMESII